jgi:hypothetical protein
MILGPERSSPQYQDAGCQGKIRLTREVDKVSSAPIHPRATHVAGVIHSATWCANASGSGNISMRLETAVSRTTYVCARARPREIVEEFPLIANLWLPTDMSMVGTC